MNRFIDLLVWLAQHGRWILLAGLVIGVAAPDLALVMRGWLPELVGLMLFVVALRVGHRQAFGVPSDFRRIIVTVLVLQLVFPMAMLAFAHCLGLSGALAIALILVTAASPISGSPNLTLMTGNDPAPSLRLLIAGTGLLPFTVLPVLWAMPALGSAATIQSAVFRLLTLIAVVSVTAFGLRAMLAREPAIRSLRAVDGVSAILMGVLVVGLMSAVGPALINDPQALGMNLMAAFTVNFGLQIATSLVLRSRAERDYQAFISIAAGNRNIALFLVALPPHITDPLLLFIGCYQVPMYLTPLFLGFLYRNGSRQLQ